MLDQIDLVQSRKKASTSRSISIITATALGMIGAVGTVFGAMYIAGMFGLSTAFASQIVSAISVGGLALSIVMGLLSGGTAAVVIATARWAVSRMGQAAAVA